MRMLLLLLLLLALLVRLHQEVLLVLLHVAVEARLGCVNGPELDKGRADLAPQLGNVIHHA